MSHGDETFWEGATFMPHDRPGRSECLSDKVWEVRNASFLAFALKLSFEQPEVYSRSGLSDLFQEYISLTSEESKRLSEYPPFLICLKQTLNSTRSEDDLGSCAADMRRVFEECPRAARVGGAATLPATDVRVTRYDVDPLIAAAAYPEYRCPGEAERRECERKAQYPLEYFTHSVSVALQRVKNAWPEAYEDFGRFVHLVVDMVDSDFTSYSASDHTGVIFVSLDAGPLIALEEFLMHELGHQILYRVMELDPLLANNPDVKFVLPWSGNERDFYGYFHAFYIYTMLACYLARCQGRSSREQRRIKSRRSHIMKGLAISLPFFESSSQFTLRGRSLFENLKSELAALGVSA